MRQQAVLAQRLLEIARLLDPVTEAALDNAQGATLTQLAALRHLQSSPMSVSELARRLGVHRSTASRLGDRLLASEWVTREASASSGREVVVTLTPKGASVVRDVAQDRQRRLERMVRGIPEREQAVLADGLQRLLRELTAQRRT